MLVGFLAAADIEETSTRMAGAGSERPLMQRSVEIDPVGHPTSSGGKVGAPEPLRCRVHGSLDVSTPVGWPSRRGKRDLAPRRRSGSAS